MEEIFSVQTPRGTERREAEGRRKGRACWDCRNWTQRWALSTGSPSGGWGQEEEVSSARQREEEGWLSRLSDSASRFKGSLPVGAVGVWKAVGGQRFGETGEGAEGPDADGGCLADIQCQCGRLLDLHCALS